MNLFVYDVARRFLYFKESSMCWWRQRNSADGSREFTIDQAYALRKQVDAQVIFDSRMIDGTFNAEGVEFAALNMVYFDQWKLARQETIDSPTEVTSGPTWAIFIGTPLDEGGAIYWTECLGEWMAFQPQSSDCLRQRAESLGAKHWCVRHLHPVNSCTTYSTCGEARAKSDLEETVAAAEARFVAQYPEHAALARGTMVKLPPQVLLGHCKECSAQIPAVALKQGMCVYCAHSHGLDVDGNERPYADREVADGHARLDTRAHEEPFAGRRLDAVLLAERPKPSRDSNLPHPWEAWSTPGDES